MSRMNFGGFGPPLFALIFSVAIFVELYRWQNYKNWKRDGSPEKTGLSDNSDAGNTEDDDEDAEEKIIVKCFFGSQTGTAEYFAKQVAKSIAVRGFQVKIVDLEDTTNEMLHGRQNCHPKTGHVYHIYLMATYGEGDPTDNAIVFMNYLQKCSHDNRSTPGIAASVRFSVFALGNTQYENYNNIGKTVRDRLISLGGTELHPIGLGDDDGDIEEDFNDWQEGLVEAFVKDAFCADGNFIDKKIQ